MAPTLMVAGISGSVVLASLRDPILGGSVYTFASQSRLFILQVDRENEIQEHLYFGYPRSIQYMQCW